ncbi:MAG: nitroreductase family protein [Bacteroidia bacterium]|nr:nitroreductase family protein [Bacteroidia bacterium]
MIDSKKMLEIISTRQSDRKYSDKPVEQDKLDRITEAGRISPSACNGQPWRFIVVTDQAILKKVADAASAKLLKMNTFLHQATAMIVVIREGSNITSQVGGTVKAKDYSLIDIGIASENICLQAEAEGLGSCMVGWFDEVKVKKLLSVPRSKRIELIITLGYSEAEQRIKKRKLKKEVVSYNKY